MFIPVQVEIQPGSWCIGVMPVKITPDGKAVVDFFRAECLDVKINFKGTKLCKMDLMSVMGTNPWMPDYRVCDFTFGGLFMSNAKFDPDRIDAEDAGIITRASAKMPDPNAGKNQNP